MENGRIAAVGSADGNTTIVQFSDGLIDMQLNEKQSLTSVSEFTCTVGCPKYVQEGLEAHARRLFSATCKRTGLIVKQCHNVL